MQRDFYVYVMYVVNLRLFKLAGLTDPIHLLGMLDRRKQGKTENDLKCANRMLSSINPMNVRWS